MAIIVNVNGKLKELYRVFFNDGGVIREFDSVYTQIKSGEIKLLFQRTTNMTDPLSWVTKNIGGSGTKAVLKSVTNNGYSLKVHFSQYKRSLETRNKIYLPAGTLIKVEVSNIEYDNYRAKYPCTTIHLYDSESGFVFSQFASIMGQSLTMNVKTSGNYYFAPNVISYTVSNPSSSATTYRVTANMNITITLP